MAALKDEFCGIVLPDSAQETELCGSKQASQKSATQHALCGPNWLELQREWLARPTTVSEAKKSSGVAL
jgi:hypothetical protein